MGIAQRIHSLLNVKIEIDMNKRINRNKALVSIGVLAVFLVLAGYYIGNRWFWPHNQNYYENKIGSLQEALKTQPESSSIRAELAMANYLNGDISKSISTLKDILSEEPDNGQATLYLGLILSEQKEPQKSIDLLTAYVKKNQGLETRIGYLYLGMDYFAIGKYNLALKSYNDAAVRDPGNPVIYYNMGQTYEKLKDKRNAIISYERAIKIAGNYVEADNALKSLNRKK